MSGRLTAFIRSDSYILDAALQPRPRVIVTAIAAALTVPASLMMTRAWGVVGLCVAIFLGSHQRYVQRFFASANTYYLTKGWLEAFDEPLTDYLDYVKEFDQETADYLVEMKYKHYRKLCMVGFSQEELDSCRPAAMKVADFCRERFGMTYE